MGGFELGIEKATKGKWECIGFSEIDKYAIQTYLKNFSNHKNYGDATKINPRELSDFDMLCGGFPCQAFSIAGKRKGFEDTRGTMFFEIARILKVKRPKIVFLENVKGLLNHEEGQTFSVILEALDELGYETQWMVLNSKFFGVPQNRERVFIIGSLRGQPRPEILPFKRGNQEFIGEENPTRQSNAITATYWKGGKGTEIMSEIDYVNKSDKKDFRTFNKYGICPNLQARTDTHKLDVKAIDVYNKKLRDECPTLTEPHHNSIRLKENTSIRKLTPTECERLQGFPDGWTEGVSDTQRYKQMGNAVTVNVIEAIVERLMLCSDPLPNSLKK